MSRITGKFIAVILALWLPLFSGNALAMSVAMRTTHHGSHSAVAAQQDALHCDSTAQQHAHHAAVAPDQSAGHQSAAEECGVCHLACCGYLAVTSLEVTGGQPPATVFLPASAQFRSITSTPLDPPPLARI